MAAPPRTGDESSAGRIAPADKPVATVDELIQMGAALADLHRYDEAITTFTLALKQEPNNGIALADRALAYAWVNKMNEAEKDLEAAQKLLPDIAILHRVRAIIADRRSDEDTELVELTKSLTLEPDNAFALGFRASIYQGRHQYAAALRDADAYIRARPEEPEAYEMKAELLISQQKWIDAAAQAHILTTRFARDARALGSAAEIYRRMGRRADALSTIDRAIDLDDGFYYLWQLRAGIRRWDDLAGRRLDLDEALRLSPGNLDIITRLGLLDFDQENWSDARKRFSEVLDKDPKDFGVLAYRAMTELKLGNRAMAEKDYAAAEAAASGPGDLSRICGAFSREGIALEWALRTCNRAVSAQPDQASYWANLALTRLRLGDVGGAIDDYSRSISKDSTNSAAYYGRALAHFRRGDRLEAKQDRSAALALDPTIEETFVSHRLGDLEKMD